MSDAMTDHRSCMTKCSLACPAPEASVGRKAMSDSVDYADLGTQVFAAKVSELCRGEPDLTLFGEDVAAIFRAHGWTPPPLGPAALPPQACDVCGKPAYLGERRCSKCRREPVPDRQCAWGGYECNEPVRGHKHFCDYHRTQHSP